MNAPFAAFPEQEHRQRLVRARAGLADAGLAGCISVAPENLFYLAGFDSFTYVTPQALVFDATGNREPTLIVRDVDLPLVRDTSWIEDVRTYRLHAANVATLVAEVAREHGIDTGRVGIELASFALPGSYSQALHEAVHPVEVVDATTLLNALQYVKSYAEMVYVREAARYAEIGISTTRESLRAGITEIQLCAEIEFAMRRAGSDYPAIPTECASGTRSPGGHATPMPRTIGTGELVHVEFAGAARRYHSISMITAAIGDPGSRARQIYDLGIESYRAGLALCAPGAAVAEIEEASLEPLRRKNLEHAAMMRFGLGIGIGYPPAWVGTFQMDRYSDARLAPGMVFYIHSCLELLEEGIGVISGGSYHVGEHEIERLSGAADCDLHIA